MAFVELGGGSEAPEESGATSDESMLEQHLRAFKRALDAGNFKQAAECFSAAQTEAGSAEPDADDEAPVDDEY
jgi:L-alanine-DL-glutamate epimerase-like enolase superfamily enzyme